MYGVVSVFIAAVELRLIGRSHHNDTVAKRHRTFALHSVMFQKTIFAVVAHLNGFPDGVRSIGAVRTRGTESVTTPALCNNKWNWVGD